MTKVLTIAGIIGIVMMLGLIMITIKPTDQECIFKLRGQAGADPVTIWREIQYNRYMLRIEDHVVYKNIYSAIDGRKIGTAIFGTVFTN